MRVIGHRRRSPTSEFVGLLANEFAVLSMNAAPPENLLRRVHGQLIFWRILSGHGVCRGTRFIRQFSMCGQQRRTGDVSFQQEFFSNRVLWPHAREADPLNGEQLLNGSN